MVTTSRAISLCDVSVSGQDEKHIQNQGIRKLSQQNKRGGGDRHSKEPQ